LTGTSRRNRIVNIKYFADTDTALMEFSEKTVDETREISESIYIDLDVNGNLVSMTIEHAKAMANLPDLSFQQIGETRESA
jgi:uncharacterized protein YuzE